nr:NADP-dependent oxidoreductase [uncultured Sphingomonas sp.]
MTINRRWTLARSPSGKIAPDDFALVEQPLDTAEPVAGEMVVRNRLFSVAPTIRNRLKPAGQTHRGAIPVGGTIGGIAGCEVIASAHPRFPVGSRLIAMSHWEDVSRLRPDHSGIPTLLIPAEMTFDDALGPYSLNSLTAYFGMQAVARPRAGETVLVSGAAGSVGSVACQIARLTGCRVIGIAGGASKCRWLTEELGLAAAIDYRAEDVGARLAELAPEGIHVFFDNVGGDILQAAVDNMARHGRIALCGQIAAYDGPGSAPGPRDMMKIVYGAIRMEGFVVGDFADQYDAAQEQLRQWVAAGALTVRIDRRQGFEQLPIAFTDLFSGANQGSLLVVNDNSLGA